METYYRLINVTLEFNNTTHVIMVEPYKKISYIKQQAQNYFYFIEEDFKMFKDNKDLTKYENYFVGDIFRGQEKLQIRLKADTTKQKKSKKRLLLGSYDPQNSLSFSQAITDSSVNSSFNDEQQNTRYVKIQLCSCQCGIIEYLCRNCNEFICNSCRQSKTHLMHSVIRINIKNFEESAKLYAITVQNEIIGKNKYIISEYEHNKKLTYVSAVDRNEELIKKLMEIQKKYQDMINVLKISNERMKEMDDSMNKYKYDCRTAEEELNQIIEEVYNIQRNKNSVMDFEQFKDVCKRIKEKEDNLKDSSCDIFAYDVTYEINKQIDWFYNELNKFVDDINNAEVPLKINYQTYMAFEEIQNLRSKKLEEDFEDYIVGEEVNEENENEDNEHEVKGEKGDDNNDNEENNNENNEENNEENINENNEEQINESQDNNELNNSQH